MNADNAIRLQPRPLETIFKEQVDNMMECGHSLSQLFLHLNEPVPYITQVKQLEENGDRLTAEAYHSLETLQYCELSHLTEQFVKYLDDIVDGINNTARSIDIFRSRTTENAAQELLSTLLSMITRLQTEIAEYPQNELARVRACRETLKGWEENADVIYHEWRKAQRRLSALPLIDESNWTEILGILEQTTDSCYHAALLLERITQYRLRESAKTG